MSKFPKGFLIGASTSAHQVEGNNIHSDYWTMEQMKSTSFLETLLYWKLIPTAPIYQGNNLSRLSLEGVGINRHVQYMELNDDQVAFIDSHFVDE